MCKLKFKYRDDMQQTLETKSINIPDNIKKEFEEGANKIWAPICQQLNETDGYIEAFVSEDGLFIQSARLVAGDWLMDFCAAANLPNAITITHVHIIEEDDDLTH